jgi:hypothetical protein
MAFPSGPDLDPDHGVFPSALEITRRRRRDWIARAGVIGVVWTLACIAIALARCHGVG